MAERQGEPRQWTPQLSLDQLDVSCWLSKHQRLVIKIDVERYEFEVLAGAKTLLALDHAIALCIEVPPTDRARLEDLLGSRFQAIDPSRTGHLPVMTNSDPSNLFYANDLWLRGV